MQRMAIDADPAPIRGLRVRVVEIPLPEPVSIGSMRIASTAIVLIDLETARGTIGRGYLHAFQPSRIRPLADLLKSIAELAVGRPAEPGPLQSRLAASLAERLRHEPDLLAAIGLVDMACWDACALDAGVPLGRLVAGQEELAPVPAYLTSALGCAEPERIGEEAARAARRGFTGYKIQLGHPTIEMDVAAIRAASAALPEATALMVDYVQGLTEDEAIRRGRRLDEMGIAWIEDPTACDDLEGHAAIARAVATPIQLGETFLGPEAMEAAIAVRASDYMMIDLPRIGGVTGWLGAASLAESADIPLSSHLYPEFAVHLLAATPARHWLEYSDLAAPIVALRPAIRDGTALVPERPGAGIVWNEEAVRRYAIAL